MAWKVYNNTFIGLSERQRSLGIGGRQLQTPDVYVYNNLFYSIGDRTLLSGARQATGAHYDGNVFRRSASDQAPLLSNFGDGDTYATLQDFHEAQEKLPPPARWETNAIEIVDDDPRDPRPLLDEATILAPIFELARLWEMYRPKNHPEIFTAGADLPAAWPGAAGVNYRGAVGPGEMPAVGPQ